MTDNIRFDAENKNMQGTTAARSFRKAGKIPAIIYGGQSKEKSIAIKANEFEKERKKGGFNTRLVELVLDGKTITTIARSVQFHPVSGKALHIDFQEVSENSTIKMNVHVRVINEEKCPGLKMGGVVNLVYRSLPMMCPVGNIPKHLDVDVAGLKIGDSKHISEIKLPEGVTPVDKTDFTVVSIGGNIAEEETAAEEGADADAEKTDEQK